MVVTGRAADSALFLAPFAYEFGWADDDWDNLARGIMAGHLLECGGQGAGGNYMCLLPLRSLSQSPAHSLLTDPLTVVLP